MLGRRSAETVSLTGLFSLLLVDLAMGTSPLPQCHSAERRLEARRGLFLPLEADEADVGVLLRIFSVAVPRRPLRAVTVQWKVRPGSTLTSDGQSTRSIFTSSVCSTLARIASSALLASITVSPQAVSARRPAPGRRASRPDEHGDRVLPSERRWRAVSPTGAALRRRAWRRLSLGFPRRSCASSSTRHGGSSSWRGSPSPGTASAAPRRRRAPPPRRSAARSVIKSQVLTGGRMKAGGVRFADTPEEAEAARRGGPRARDQRAHAAGRARRPEGRGQAGVLRRRRLGRDREAAADAVQRHGRDRHRGGRGAAPGARRPRAPLEPDADRRLRGQAGDRRDRRHRRAS